MATPFLPSDKMRVLLVDPDGMPYALDGLFSAGRFKPSDKARVVLVDEEGVPYKATGGGGGGVTGSGTIGMIPMWTGATALGDSIIRQSGDTIDISSITASIAFRANDGIALTNAGGDPAAIAFQSANGTLVAPEAVTDEQQISVYSFKGYGDTGYRLGATLYVSPAQVFTDSHNAAYFGFLTVPFDESEASLTEQLRIGWSHDVGAPGIAAYNLWLPDIAGLAANPYYSWFDSRGVRRVKEDNTFDSLGQAIEALYNPQFTKYTPGATDFERIILGQWNGNVAEVGTEAGGTGTKRKMKLLQAGLIVENLPTSDPGVPGQLYRTLGTVMVSL